MQSNRACCVQDFKAKSKGELIKAYGNVSVGFEQAIDSVGRFFFVNIGLNN